MQTLITQQVFNEVINQVAHERGIDPLLVEHLIRHQFSVVRDSMIRLDDVRLYKFGVFKMKNKYRRMYNEFGYVYGFPGKYVSERDKILSGKIAKYIYRLEESDLEKKRGRIVSEGKSE